MPGRKRSDRSGPIHRRARTGCKTCRARKVKCDEAKPTCRNCSTRGIACDNGVQLKWHEEFQSRGVAFGREGVWTKDPDRLPGPGSPSWTVSAPVNRLCLPIIGPQHFLNTTYSDFDPRHASLHEASPGLKDVLEESSSKAIILAPVKSIPGRPVIPRALSPFSSLGDLDTGLLEYYLKRLCPLTTSSRICPSPFADLIQPLCTTSGQEDVMRALMAFSARHRSITDPRWSETAMALKGGVLVSLQKRLSSPDSASLGAVFSHVLIIMMFLCLYEIVDKCDHRWVIHLRASQDIIRRCRALGFTHAQGDAGGLAAFAERFFAFQDAISRTACGDAPLFGVDYWDNLTNKTEVDSWMGCSPELAGILCDITELGRSKSTETIPSATFFETADVLERRIHSLAATTRVPNDDELMLSAELKRLSASLYLHCVLYDASPSTPLVARLVKDILERIHQLLRTGSARALAFPVFVAAVELDATDDVLIYDYASGESIHGRRLILEALDAMATHSLSNVTRTRAVIQKVWRLRDMDMNDGFSQQEAREVKSEHRANDWTTFVGPNSSYISLA
ncbi:hypothetical protein JX265_013146 [Neoarthrinium moseri]|uniref:Zn(2)-C6 fungal-type domain-containing protein n=1 Tax=Neoarthrinium moseri TaxID=1658444 RepID=A0A9P9W9B5_9PEZI|nr:hypothetical protein JX265_013146 [Neoarthrinium moseri]